MRESIPQKNIPVVLQSFTQVHESKLPTPSPPTVLLLLHHPQTGDFNGLQVLPVLNCKTMLHVRMKCWTKALETA